MLARFDRTLALAMALCGGAAIAQPFPPAAGTPPSIQRPAEGTLPIVPCPENADRGCIEILYDGEQPPVVCWTLPPFGSAAVRVELAPVQPAAQGSTTRRMTIQFHPLREVPAGTPATLQFAFPRAGAPLVCDQTLVVARPASTLALPGDLDLGALHVDVFGRVTGASLRQPVFPASGQLPVGPITLSPRADLFDADRRGAPVPVRLTMPPDAVVTAHRFATMEVTFEGTGAFPALGPLTGRALLTAPQLTAPLGLTIRATSQIGWISILLMLVLGILSGALVHRWILPRQALARARLDAERAALAAEGLRDRELDGPLRAELDDLIRQHRTAAQSASDPAALTQAAQTLSEAVRQQLAQADARRQELAGAIGPARAALATVPPSSELARAALADWGALLDVVQALVEAREIARPERLLRHDLPPVEARAKAALMDLADTAAEAIGALGQWTRPATVEAFAPLRALAGSFAPDAEIAAAEALTTLRAAHHALRQAVAANGAAIATILLELARGAEHARFPAAMARTHAVLRDIDGRPVAALSGLASLVRDYQTYVQGLGQTSFEDLANFRGGTESPPGPLAKPGPALPPAEAVLAIRTEPDLSVAGRPLALRLVGLPPGRTALVQTPIGSAHIRGQHDPDLVIRPPRPGPIPVEIILFDDQGRELSRRILTLTVQPAPETAVPALLAEVQRSDRTAIAAAAAIALLSGSAVFSVVPLTSWWGLLAPFLWGFFVNLNLPDAIQSLQARRDAVFKSQHIV